VLNYAWILSKKIQKIIKIVDNQAVEVEKQSKEKPKKKVTKSKKAKKF